MKWDQFVTEYRKYPLSKTSTWYHREIIGRLTKPVVFLALNMGLSANMTTFASFIFVLLAMVLIVIYPWSIWVGLANFVLLQLAFILDCADGMVARIKHQTSDFGKFFDIFVDLLSHLFVFIGFGIYYYFINYSPNLGWLVLIIFSSTMYFVYYLTSEFRGLIFLDIKGSMLAYGVNFKEKVLKFPYHFISRPVFFGFLSVGYIFGILEWIFLAYGILSLFLILGMLIILYRRYNNP
jgi:phosphatidylglycerophosphate synthase